MRKRITITDVRPAFTRYAEACKAAGLIPEGMHVVLQEGSQTYGRAWRVNLTGDMVRDAEGRPTFPKGSSHNRPPVGDDYLGWTAAEALTALQERTTGIWAGLDGPLPTILVNPPAEWRGIINGVSDDYRNQLRRDAEEVAERAAYVAAYLSSWEVSEDHKRATKRAQRAVLNLRKVFGYTYPEMAFLAKFDMGKGI